MKTDLEDARALVHIHRAEMLLSGGFFASAASELRDADMPRLAAIVAAGRPDQLPRLTTRRPR